MTLLKELLTLSSSERRHRLRHVDVRDALQALGKVEAVAWLERNLESPIGPEWGDTLYILKPDWEVLDRWIRLSKEHCLAAVDTLLKYAPHPDSDGSKTAELPSGATATLVNSAIKFALDHYGNPRLQDAAKVIRHTWPAGKRKRRAVKIPRALRTAASTLFGKDAKLMKAWRDSLSTAMTQPETAEDFWESLLDFADGNQVVAIVDWREAPESIVDRLLQLKSANDLQDFLRELPRGQSGAEDLFREIGERVREADRLLVSLDTGGDSYALTILSMAEVSKLEPLLVKTLNVPEVIETYE